MLFYHNQLPTGRRLLLISLFLALFFNVQAQKQDASISVVITSNGFNAKSRSSFLLGEKLEDAKRGLTLVHILPNGDFEQKTFDTYSKPETMETVLGVIAQMEENGAKFVLLAHDSAVSGKGIGAKNQIEEMGLPLLSQLKGRQAYIMHNLNGSFEEKVDDLTLRETLTMNGQALDSTIYFPKKHYEFEASVDRYIAHAGGEINGVPSTNSLEALDENYKKGFRLFELDIIETSDGHFVAAHDWNMWARFTDYNRELPPTLEEFKKHKIYGDYTTLDMEAINTWFSAHKDAQLITDKVNRPADFAGKFCDISRLKMELFSLLAIDEALSVGVEPIISQTPLLKFQGDKLEFLKVNSIGHVALSRRIIDTYEELVLQLKENGIRVYVYNVNFDQGKDERYVQENELGLVYGMYADNWVFDSYLMDED